MLLNIKIKNVNAIKECNLDFKKASYKYLPDSILDDVVNPMSIYGHNGSGKTSVLRAMGQLIDMMTIQPNFIRPFVVNVFTLNEVHEKNRRTQRILSEGIGSIELTFDLGKSKIYTYHISTYIGGFIYEESLYKGKTLIYTYHCSKGLKIKDEEMDRSFHQSCVPFIRKLAAIKVENKEIQRVFDYLSNFIFVDLPNKNSLNGFVHSKMHSSMKTLDLLVKYSDEVREILSKYEDFPLYVVRKDETNFGLGIQKNQYRLVLEDSGVKREIAVEYMSAGMFNNSLLLSIALSTPKNGVIFIDELEQALHPTAVLAFLDIIKEKKIQLVFTSHNTNILQYLRPDQIYFAKWRDGSSHYYRLSEIYPNIREINNIEKMYLSNLFEEYMNGN